MLVTQMLLLLNHVLEHLQPHLGAALEQSKVLLADLEQSSLQADTLQSASVPLPAHDVIVCDDRTTLHQEHA
jgi:hypothetical protein